jgi:energy-coupling factor transport system ATP-binding protein
MIIRLRDVSFTYTTGTAPALHSVTLDVPAGQVLGVVGRAGAGKSTLCALCAGFVPHFYHGQLAGVVTVDGQDVIQQPVAALIRHVALVSSNAFSQISGARTTVAEEIGFGLENLGVPRDEMRERIAWALDAMQITHLAERSPFALSGGQQQRTVIAAALAMRPPVLVLDEPTAQLDPPTVAELGELLRSLARAGTTVVFAEHHLEWTAELADRVIVLGAGAIVADGPPEILADPSLDARGVGRPRSATIAEQIRAEGMWPAGRPLPVTLAGLVEGLRANRNGPTAKDDGMPAASAPPAGVAASGQAPRTPAAATDAPSSFILHPSPKPPLIIAEDVHFTYPSGVAALKGVSLAIGAGERLALLGRNGAGKSTLLRHLNGLLRPSGGRVLVAGEDTRRISVARAARTAALVFQDVRNQLFARTVRDELRFGPRNLGLPAARAEQLVERALAALGLADVAAEHPYDLPAPRRRLVAVAAVLAMGTDLLVLDEPTAGLDSAGVALLAQLTRDLAAEGRSVLVVSHDLNFCFENLGRIVLLRDGQIALDAPRDALAPDQLDILDATVGLPLALRAAREL